MSTRAIIAIPTENGYTGAWNWYDSFPNVLGRILRSNFKTLEQAEKLISYKAFGSIYTAKEKAEIDKLNNYIEISGNSKKPLFLSHIGVDIEKHPFPYHFDSIADMLAQDINYVYVFENGKWNTYK